ncbi:MAG TPA: hypothetical protein PLU54_09810 [Deltaproteobacteria bacterium]|nr:hypothetical protein [Deltaproteobacteria bacterium]
MNLPGRSRKLSTLAWSMFALWLVLSACSDGSSSHRGYFIDSPVEGLTYETNTLSGTTDGRGTFYFSPGEQVKFFVGGLPLGFARGRDVITPLDLVPGASDENNQEVVNIVRLLTLDADANPENGITIDQEVQDAIPEMAIIFNQNYESFALDPHVQEIVDIVNSVLGLSETAARGLCTAEQASAHLANTLDELSNYTPAGHDGNASGGGATGGG